MEIKEHKKRHKLLHEMLDELIADFITNTEALPSKTKLTELMSWSNEQTINPTEKNLENGRKICKKSGKPIELGYCDDCMHDTEERESKMGCEPK